MMKLSARILLFLLLGGPLAGYIWHTLNDLLSGHFDGTRLAIAVPAAALLLLLLRWIARFLQRLEPENAHSAHPPEETSR